MLNLEQFSKIMLNDYTGYKSDLCNNGGCYGFWTEYTNLGNGNWKVPF